MKPKPSTAAEQAFKRALTLIFGIKPKWTKAELAMRQAVLNTVRGRKRK